MADKRKRIKLHKCFSDAQHGRVSKDSVDISQSSYRVKVDLNQRRETHLLNLMRAKIARLKINQFRNKVEPAYPKITARDTAHEELRALADLLPTTPINKYVVRDIIKRTGMKELQLKYPNTIKSVVNEFSEEFVKVTHETGLNFRVRPVDGSESHIYLQPYKFHGKTQNYKKFLRNRESLKKNLCIHYPLIRKILKHSADLPNLLIDFSQFREAVYEIHSLRFRFMEEFNNGLETLKTFLNTISETVKSGKFKIPKNPDILERYLRTGTRLISSVISRVLRNTIHHLIEVTENDDLIPYMKLHLYYKNEFELTPTAEDTYILYEEMIYKISRAANGINSLENLILHSETFIPIYIQSEFLENCFEQTWMNIYTKYQAIYAHVENVKSEFKTLETKRVEDYQKDITFEGGMLEVDYYRKLSTKVDGIRLNEFYPIAMLDQEYCKINLKKLIRNYIQVIGCKLSRQHEWENDDICQTFQNLAARAEKVPNTSQELIDKGIYMATASTDLLEELSIRINRMLLQIADLMGITTISSEHMRLNSSAIGWLFKIKPIIESNAKLYENYKFEFEERLVNEVAQLNDDIAEIIPFLTILDSMNDSKRAKEYANQMSNILVRIRNCEKQKIWINSEEKIFKYPVSPFVELEEVKAWIYNFYHLLKLCINWNRYNNAWMDGPFEFLIPSESERIVVEYEIELLGIQKMYRNQLKQMAADNNPRRFQGSVDDPDPLNQPAPLQLCRQILLKIEEFKPNLSLMSIVCNPALLQRHWDEMSEIAGFDMTPNAGTTLRKITAMDLGPNMEGYEIISSGAIKELQLITNLKAMIAEWDVVNFKTSLYKDTNLLVLVDLDYIQVILDDHTIKTLAMRGSVFVKPYETEVKAWYDKIVRVSATIEVWGSMQIKWLKLLPIFSSKDIVNQMPIESKLFQNVNTTYKKYIQTVREDPNVLKIAGGVGLLEDLETCAYNLEKINEGVNTYLEKKRLYFPRFFFLSNEEMLEILSETKDPLKVQPHLKKCFEGIDTLGFNSDLEIFSMQSKNGEVVKFSKIINTKVAGANVEEWLKQVEKRMFETILASIYEARKDHLVRERLPWMLSWPGQVVLTVSKIFSTANIHIALRKKPRFTLSDYSRTLDLELKNAIEMVVKPEISNFNRITIKSLIIADIHTKNIVIELLNKNVSSDTDFHWIIQMRYYWEESKVTIRILNSTLHYQNEYIGNSERLVVTPLTDRCFRSLINAYNVQLNGAPIGPASSGKTETVKDLARAIGVRCLVFNCSDGINYNIMGKFFKGSACSGAWVCFDEFNRIEVSVLSVLAQHILFIIQGLKMKTKTFNFEGTELILNPSCFICLTMNPGYTGRSELPDNLKVSFRTVAMMVPDYALIAEVTLTSIGYKNAPKLGQKIATVYNLCSRQLSDQNHYDFSLRSIKVVLDICGRNIQQKPERNEDVMVSRSIVQVILPKLIPEDVLLFEAIIKDIFHQCDLSKEIDYEFVQILKSTILKQNLYPKDSFLDKILDINEMVKVKHGFMLVGAPCVGKSAAIKVLADALALDFGMDLRFINPKSLTVKQLYGEVDANTNEWVDGILAATFRKFVTPTQENPKWIIFDGPVDTLWVENMNSVLDDNRKLCLTSGEIIPMKSNMSIIFEVENLAQVSPSTISRCGMIYFESNTVGWAPLVESWKLRKDSDWYRDNFTLISKYFDWMVDPCLNFIEKNCKQVCILGNINLVKNMFEMIEMILDDACLEVTKKDEDYRYIVSWVQATFISAGIWGLGATLEQDSRPKFDEFYRSLWKGEIEEYKYPTGITRLEMLLPNDGLLIDYYYIYKLKGVWKYWHEISRSQRVEEFTNLPHTLIPTVETVKYGNLLERHIRHKKRMLLVGPTGTGKSYYTKDFLINRLDQQKYEPSFLTFTVKITANETQDMFISKLHKIRRGHYGPPKGKTSIIFVDDLNMPEKEVYGAQPAIELLRYYFDYGNLLDLKDMRDIYLHEVVMVAAMGLVGGCRQELTNRFLRHFNVYFINAFTEESVSKIFSNILWLGYKNNGFPNDITNMVNTIVAASIELYQFAIDKLRPTPNKTHYIFNLRDFSKVIFGCALLKKETAEDKRIFARLWVHETMRVFYDRLVDEYDRYLLFTKIRSCIEDHFKDDFEKIFEDFKTEEDQKISEQDLAKLMFGTCFNSDCYEEISNPDTFFEIAINALKEYNLENDMKMDLVLFKYAIEHLSRICRILTVPAGNGLLIGINGVGRQSLTKLATFMARYSFFQPEVSNGYGIHEWRDDLKTVLKESGGKGKSSTFLLSDHQIIEEMFLQDIDCLLNSGEVPNMFAMDEKQEVLEMVRLDAQGGNRNLDITALTVFTFFVKRCKEKLHIILSFNPINKKYRHWLRTYPSLINCCTIDWFDSWPETALEAVAKNWIREVNLTGEIKESTVVAFKHFHTNAKLVSEEFFLATSTKNYITSATYLELVKSFNHLTITKQDEIKANKNRYMAGLEKLQNAADAVATMQKDLADFQPQLQEMTIKAIEMTKQIAKETIEVEKASAVVREDEKLANIQAANSQYLKRECEADLADAIPILEDAIEALNTLKPSDITLVKSMKNPPEAVKLVMAGVCVMRDIKPDRINDASTGGKILDYWGPSKRLLGDMNFLQHLKDFDKDHIKLEIMSKIRKEYLPNKLFKPHIVAKASSAAEGLCKWIIAMDMYDAVAKEVAPKKEKLELAEKEYQTTAAFLMEKKQQLAKLEEKLANLNDALDEAKAKQKELQENVDLCASKLLRAEKLLGGLGGEKLRWIQAADNLQLLFDSLAGDVLICCGLIAYLSPYTLQFRTSTIKTWHMFVKGLTIPCSDDFDFCNVLGSDFKIQNWTINGLPKNVFSIQNAIIQDSSRRWSLLIDPQSQGNIWIKKMEKENGLLVAKFSNNYIKTLKHALEFGKPVLIENISEELEPTIDPILHKSGFIKDEQVMIRFAKNMGPYHQNFRLYLTTKLRKPHFLPQVSNKVTIINFGIMLDGLKDQLLDIVVAKERPDLQKQCEELIKKCADNKAALADVEESILKTLSESKGDILEDESAIEVLDNSKILSMEIVAKQKSLKERELEIEDSRMDFKSIAVHSALLYYSIADLPNVDPMYQFSLEWFINLYIRSIESANKSRVLERRLRFLKDAFTYNLFATVCMALFEKDKLMFAFLLCTKIQIAEKKIEESELKFILQSEVRTLNELPFHWVTDHVWNQLSTIEQLSAFTGFINDFLKHEDDWKEFYEHKKMPVEWNKKLSQFQKLILTKIFHRDIFHENVSKFIHDEMGKKFTNPLPFDISRSYDASTCICPLVFILSPGTDPMETLTRFAERKRMSKKFYSVSMGQEQGPIALKIIENAQNVGAWVCLQNCHLADNWLPVLERFLETVKLCNTHANFRLWITSCSTETFPISILQSSVKITNETPCNLQQNLLQSYISEPIKDPEFFAGCPGKEDMFARLLYGIAFFHAVIQERRTYGSLPYNFNQIDFNTSIQQLQIFINDYNDITYETIPYILGECNYGGKVTDIWDRRLLATLISSFINKELVTVLRYKLVNLETYYGLPRRFNYDDYLDHIKLLPQVHPPEVFGLHSNEGIIRDIKVSDYLLKSMILIQGETSPNYNQNTGYQLMTIATDILNKILPLSNISLAKCIDFTDCFSVVLRQEINRFNALLQVIITSLSSVQEAVKGNIIMSESLEILVASLIKREVPKTWKLVSYPTLKNLSEYITDLALRLEFFKQWSEYGIPDNFWISGFFNTAAFIAGIKQNHSRQTGLPAEQLTFDYEVISELVPRIKSLYKASKDKSEIDVTIKKLRDVTQISDTVMIDNVIETRVLVSQSVISKKGGIERSVSKETLDSEIGVRIYGLFLQGARWDVEEGTLKELRKRVFCEPMPTIWIKPILKKDFVEQGRYECPVFITAARRGRISTSGVSNNFVLPVWLNTEDEISHWIKREVALLCQIE